MKRSVLVGTMLILMLGSGYAVAQTGGGYDMTWWTIDGGGGTSSGASHVLAGTIGQADAAPMLTGGGYALVGGFWAGAGPGTPGGPPRVYLPTILK